MGRATDPVQIKAEKKYEASKRAATRLLERLAVKVEQLSRFVDDPTDGETYIQVIIFKMNAGWDGGVLAVVKATIGGEAMVAFHSEGTLDECMVGLASRLMNGTMKWKEDTPYENNKSGS